jgi:hypothetical protein
MKDKKNINKLLKQSSNTFVDKLASLKYVTKKDSKIISSVISDTLKKRNSYYFLITKKQ